MQDVKTIATKRNLPNKNPPLRILILEDLPTDTELVINELQEAELLYELFICRSDRDLLDRLKISEPDIILTPYSLEFTNAVKALKLFRGNNCTAPVILLAQDLSEDIAIELLKTGIEDYVLRSTLRRLPIAIKKALYKQHKGDELRVSKNMVRASQASLINMVRNMPMAVAMFDTEMRYLVVSDLWLKTEGYNEKDLIGKSHYEVVANLPERWKNTHSECLKGAIKAEDQERIVSADGSVSYLRWKINPWYSPEGKIGGIVLFTEDVTAKVVSEEKIRSSEKSLRMAMIVAKIGTFQVNLKTEELIWSEELFELAGIEDRHVTNEIFIALIHPEDRERALEQIRSRRETGKPEVISYRVETSIGELKYVETRANVICDDRGDAAMLFGTAQDVTGQKLLEQEITQKETRLRMAVDAAKLGVWEWHVENGTLSCDDRCKEIIGHPDMSINRPEDLFTIVVPDNVEAAQRAFVERSEKRTDLDVDMRTISSDGSIKQFNLKGEFRDSEHGSASVMYGVVRDRTDSLRAQKKLADKEEVFRQLTEHITEVFYLTDIPTNKVLYVSETFEEVYGLPVEELYEDSFSWSKNIHPEDLERVKNQYHDNAREGTYDEEYRIVLPDGTVKWVRDRAFPVADRNGKIVRIAGLSEDITKRVTDDRKIEMLSQVASETVNGVLIQDPEGKILWMNQAFTDITGYQAENAYGKEPWSFLSGPETDQNLIKLTYDSVNRKKAFTSENVLYKMDGTKVWISTNFTPILDSNGEISRIVSVGTDISQMKENERLQADSMHELEIKVQERTALLEAANMKLMDEISAREKMSSALALNNTDLVDSLNYAEKIQRAILPNKSALLISFDSAFILSKARNVVSGDFHWFHRTNTHTYVAAVDCTGHGVPGALMSMIGYQLLDQALITEHNADPAHMLETLDLLVRKSLKQNGQKGAVRDGMDLGLCVIDNKSLELNFAGAFNMLYHVSGAEVNAVNGNRHSIGGHLHLDNNRKFESHRIQLTRGDKLYLSTDGYVDQFGGPQGKKYMKRRFRETIRNLQSFAFSDHKSKLQKEFEDWQGPLSQVDDMLVVGVKV